MKLATIAPYIMRWSVYRFLRLSLGNILTPIITFAIVSKKAKNIVKKLKKKLHETSQFQKYIMDIIKQKENNIKYINHIQSSILDSAFSGKLLN